MQYMGEYCFYRIFIGTAHNSGYMQHVGERPVYYYVNPCHYFVITLQRRRHGGHRCFALFISISKHRDTLRYKCVSNLVYRVGIELHVGLQWTGKYLF